MKTRKFAEGGDAMEEANKGEDLAAELRGENILTAMRDAAAKPKPKRRSNPRDLEAGTSRGTRPATATREQLISQIPKDAARAPVSGESASGSELGRNIANTSNALAGLKGVQVAQMAAEGLTAPRAAATAAAAKRAELAGELRRGAQPTKFTSASKPTVAKNTRKFNEDEAGVEMRKGGAVKKYAAGGSVSSRADGIAQRGKTRGKMC